MKKKLTKTLQGALWNGKVKPEMVLINTASLLRTAGNSVLKHSPFFHLYYYPCFHLKMWKNQTGDCTCPGRKSVVFVLHVPSLNNYQVFPGKGRGRISYLVWSSRDRSFTFHEATTKQFGVCIKINFLPCTKLIRNKHHTLLASFFTYQQLTKLTMCRNFNSKAGQIRSLTPKLVVFWAF